MLYIVTTNTPGGTREYVRRTITAAVAGARAARKQFGQPVCIAIYLSQSEYIAGHPAACVIPDHAID